MSDWNPLETQLRSWTPRRPSAKLRARLFSREALSAPAPTLSLNWLAPATGCLLVLFITFGQGSVGLDRLAVSEGRPMVAITLSNQSLAAYFPGSFPHERNTVRADTLEWTNASRSHSSNHSFLRSGTNELRR